MQTSVSAGGLGAARQVSYSKQTGLLTGRAVATTEAGLWTIRGIPFICPVLAEQSIVASK